MTRRVIVDTGPLVAILFRRDAYHTICVNEAKKLQGLLVTCWPVITEAAWILRDYVPGIQRLLKAVDDGTFEILDFERGAGTWIATFIERYQSIGAQLADAALMYLAEREGIDTIFTLDRRDFSVYRLSGNRSLKMLPE